MSLPPAPRSICLLRLSALGDATHVVPMVHSIRRAWPQVPITWILGKGEAKLLEGLEGVELLKSLNAEQLSRIASIAKEVRYPPGKVILAPDQNPDRLLQGREPARLP